MGSDVLGQLFLYYNYAGVRHRVDGPALVECYSMGYYGSPANVNHRSHFCNGLYFRDLKSLQERLTK